MNSFYTPTENRTNIVNAKIKATHVSETIESAKPHKVQDSSKILLSLSIPSIFDILATREKENLFNQREIKTGRVIKTTTIIATIPQEFFINIRLEEIVFKESPINPPIIGMKLPIANLAVLKDKESALSLKTV